MCSCHAVCPQMQRTCRSLFYVVAQIWPQGSGSDLKLLGKHRQHHGHPGIHEFKMHHDIFKLLQAFLCDVVAPFWGAGFTPSSSCSQDLIIHLLSSPLPSPVLVVAKLQCRAPLPCTADGTGPERQDLPVPCQGIPGDGGECIAVSTQGHFGTCENVCVGMQTTPGL